MMMPGGRCYDDNFQLSLSIFGGKKLALFSKTNVMIKFLQKLAVVFAKTPIFLQIFWRKY
jgi:hypothetical protein